MSTPPLSIKEDVKNFCEHWVLVRSVYLHYDALFEGKEERDLLFKRAGFFAGDLNRVLVNYLILEICKLADSEKEGLSVKYFLRHLPGGAQSSVEARMKVLAFEIEQFTLKLRPARDKYIAHHDRKVVRFGVMLGAAMANEWAHFWDNVDEFINTLRCAHFGHEFSIMDIAQTDVGNLVQALRATD